MSNDHTDAQEFKPSTAMQFKVEGYPSCGWQVAIPIQELLNSQVSDLAARYFMPVIALLQDHVRSAEL